MQADEMTVSTLKALCFIYRMLPQEPQINYTDYRIFSWFII